MTYDPSVSWFAKVKGRSICVTGPLLPDIGVPGTIKVLHGVVGACTQRLSPRFPSVALMASLDLYESRQPVSSSGVHPVSPARSVGFRRSGRIEIARPSRPFHRRTLRR